MPTWSSGIPASRNARPTARGSTAYALTATMTAKSAAHRHLRTLRGIDRLERAVDEEREFVVGQRVRRHEINGVSDRAQDDLAPQRLCREALREAVACTVDVERNDHAALPKVAHARMLGERR